jgi:hypothetical protein
MKVRATSFSETSVDFQRAAKRYILEGRTFQKQFCWSLKSCRIIPSVSLPFFRDSFRDYLHLDNPHKPQSGRAVKNRLTCSGNRRTHCTGAPIILGRCPSLSAHKSESMLRTYLVCREKQERERARERSTKCTNNSDPITSTSEL